MDKNLEIKPAVVVLAAGMGSRYGGLKQVEQFGPSGETIIDYSIYDAIRAGFKKVVFIIRKNIEAEFKENIIGKFEDLIEVDFAFQEIDIVPQGVKAPKERVKPWGTGHAVLMAMEKVNGPFAVINGDDFYGARSFQLLFDHLNGLDINDLNACLIGYQLQNTLSDHGFVSRGVCGLSAEKYLEKVTERTHVYKGAEGGVYYVENEEKVSLTGKELVSMNLAGFTPPFFKVLKDGFEGFVKSNIENLKAEYFLPNAITEIITNHSVNVPVIETPDQTYGVTYQEDKATVKEAIRQMIDQGIYPKNLWA